MGAQCRCQGCTLHQLASCKIVIFCIFNPQKPPWPCCCCPPKQAINPGCQPRLSTQAVNCRRTPEGFALCRHIHDILTTVFQTSSLLRASCERLGRPRTLASPALAPFPPRTRPGYRCIATVAAVAPAPRTLALWHSPLAPCRSSGCSTFAPPPHPQNICIRVRTADLIAKSDFPFLFGSGSPL